MTHFIHVHNGEPYLLSLRYSKQQDWRQPIFYEGFQYSGQLIDTIPRHSRHAQYRLDGIRIIPVERDTAKLSKRGKHRHVHSTPFIAKTIKHVLNNQQWSTLSSQLPFYNQYQIISLFASKSCISRLGAMKQIRHRSIITSSPKVVPSIPHDCDRTTLAATNGITPHFLSACIAY